MILSVSLSPPGYPTFDPAHTAASTQEETLGSIAAHTHRSREAIVVDDGATGSTAAVVFEERDARLRGTPSAATTACVGTACSGLCCARRPPQRSAATREEGFLSLATRRTACYAREVAA